jgi:hypothetical protein
MKKVLKVSVSEFSNYTSYHIEQSIRKYCNYNNVYFNFTNLFKTWGYAYSLTLDGEQEDVETVIKLLRTEFKIKEY